MGILSDLSITDAPFVPYLNTGSMLDLLAGAFVPGTNGSTILNGGIATTDGVVGRPQVFKSTTAIGMVINAMARCPGSECVLFDTEFSIKDKRRLVNMSDMYLDDPEKREAHLVDLESRIAVVDTTEYDLETFFEVIKRIHERKMSQIKSLTVPTPILDPRTGKPRMMVVPTFVIIDSWSKGKVKSALEMLDKYTVSDSSQNPIFMREGLAKNKILGQLPRIAAQAGIYFTLTAHVGNKIEMNSYLPTPKEMQYMKQGDVLKGCGSDFLFLVSNLREVRSPKVLLDSAKECEYPLPTGLTAPAEMSSTEMVMVRCKINVSGTKFSPVVSQSLGYNTNLTNLHYLRTMGYFGLGTNKNHPRAVFLPDSPFTRKTALSALTEYRLARSIEILAQLLYVQSNWTVQNDCPVDFSMTPEALHEALSKTTYAMDDILNSRGWWTHDTKTPRSYLSLWDILAIANNTYKPKLISMAGK